MDLLRQQGVRTLAFGGRPRRGPMQAVGGVRGGQRWSLRTIERHVRTAQQLLAAVAAADEEAEEEEEAARRRRRLAALAPPPLADFALQFDRYGQGGVNFRDAYGPADGATPLQFVYEAADCRRFFTPRNVLAPATMWADAAHAMFGGGDLCVPGSRAG